MQNSQIQSRAILVKLSIGLPGFSRQDKPLTEKVKSSEHMGKESGKWTKQLYPATATEPLTQFQGKVRIWFNSQTLIWPDEGWAMLPTSKLFEYTEKMREFRSEFRRVKDGFLSKYDEYVEWARIQHNGSFDASNYPGMVTIGCKFRFITDTRPIPDSGDYVTEVSQLLGSSAREVDAAVASAVQAATAGLWERLIKPVKHMADTLKDSDAKFRDSLVENIRSILALVPALNITGDGAISKTAADIEILIANVTPQALRDDKLTRAEVAKSAEAIVSRMSGYFA